MKGTPDPWGMKVNPKYRGIDLPTAEWPLLDDFVPETGNQCRQQNPAVYFNQIAAPVTTLRKIAEALLDSWPNVQTRCDYDPSTELYKMGRIDRQAFGSRFMLGVVSWGDAQRYGLRSAALEAAPGRYVAPTPASVRSALALMTQKAKLGPFALDQAAVRKSRSAYPGTMVVYTAARLRNLQKADATKVAQFIRVSSTEGQRPGSGNGELPDGFVPMTSSGVTARFRAAALAVADAVEAQAPAAPDNEEGSGPPSGPGAGPDLPDSAMPDLPGLPDLGGVPDLDPLAANDPSLLTPERTPPPADPAPVITTPTALVASRLAGLVLPGLLFVGLGALGVSVALRLVEKGIAR